MDDKIKTLRDALEWLDRRIRDEAELDGEMTNEHAIELAFIQSMLAKFPLRNCDVGTAQEQYRRFWDMCSNKDVNQCAYCEFRRTFNLNCSRDKCFANWAQTPYAEEGAGK